MAHRGAIGHSYDYYLYPGRSPPVAAECAADEVGAPKRNDVGNAALLRHGDDDGQLDDDARCCFSALSGACKVGALSASDFGACDVAQSLLGYPYLEEEVNQCGLLRQLLFSLQSPAPVSEL